MEAVDADADVELIHRAEPNRDMRSAGAYQRDDGTVGLPQGARSRPVGPGR